MWKEVNNNKNKHAQEMCLIKSSGPQTSVTIKSNKVDRNMSHSHSHYSQLCFHITVHSVNEQKL